MLLRIDLPCPSIVSAQLFVSVVLETLSLYLAISEFTPLCCIVVDDSSEGLAACEVPYIYLPAIWQVFYIIILFWIRFCLVGGHAAIHLVLTVDLQYARFPH